ncbi:MAG: hypothetical protein PHT50_02750 [Candidatus Omnitrophica bacterium]|nr:hypothetical protein [Candidatus Omnitrophota bacterium]
MSLEKENQAGNWPVLGTKDIAGAYKFYVEKLDFVPCGQYDNVAGLEQVIVKLDGFFLVLRKSQASGPLIQAEQKIEGRQDQDRELALYIPVRGVFDYYNAIKNKGVDTVTEIIKGPDDSDLNFFNPDEDGFYLKDEDGNLLVFWTYYSDHYNPRFWAWVWELKLTPERIMQFKKPAKLSGKDKIINWGCFIVFFAALMVILAIITTHYAVFIAASLGLAIIGAVIKSINCFCRKRYSK